MYLFTSIVGWFRSLVDAYFGAVLLQLGVSREEDHVFNECQEGASVRPLRQRLHHREQLEDPR